MRYSLHSRFQGTLIGSLIGLGLFNQKKSLPWWLQLNYQLTEILAKQGDISHKEWLEIISECTESLPDHQNLNIGELMLAILPLIVFFYDVQSLLEEKLEPLLIGLKITAKQQEKLKVFSELLSFIFTENISVNRIILQLLENNSYSEQFLTEQLETIQQFLAQGTPLHQVKAHFKRQYSLEPSALALAIYCFLGTPEDFALSVQRAYQMRSLVIIGLTGAIAGAYNGIESIPCHWHLAWQQRRTSLETQQNLHNFWAMWAGVGASGQLKQNLDNLAVNSPLIMQKRPSMTLISQEQHLRAKLNNPEKQ